MAARFAGGGGDAGEGEGEAAAVSGLRSGGEPGPRDQGRRAGARYFATERARDQTSGDKIAGGRDAASGVGCQSLKQTAISCGFTFTLPASATRLENDVSRETPAGRAAPLVPDYELLRLIGRGAYGEVWLARNALGGHCAVKVVRREDFEEAR